MRRRPAPDPHAAEVARRRLEALSRELGLEAGPRAATAGAASPVDEELDHALGGVPWSPPPARRPGRQSPAPPDPPPSGWPPVTDATGEPAYWQPENGRDDRSGGAAPRASYDAGLDADVRRPPGRHALPRSTWRERLDRRSAEVPVAGGRQFGAAHLAVVALIVAVSLAVGAWHTMRGSVEQAPVAAPTLSDPSGAATTGSGGESAEPAEPAEPAGGGSEPPAAAPATSPGVGASPGSEVVVDVVGKVRRPGIAVLPVGSRVVDALKAAGGARPGVRTDSLNLARPLTDGEQIVVGRTAALTAPPAATGTAPGVGAPAAGASPTALVNLNTADQVALETLPGVGPVTAAAILQWRTEHGGFTAVEELLEVSGIGDATLAEIAPHVTI